MDISTDTFLTSVYVTVDDFCVRHPRPVHGGPPPVMSDSEVLTLMLVRTWSGISERRFLRRIHQAYSTFFPQIISHSAFNRRAQSLLPMMAALLHDLAHQLKVWEEAFEIIDGLPVPLANPARGRNHRCFTPDEAGMACGGVGKGWYYGVNMMTCITASGVITGFVSTPANSGERWAANDIFSWRHDPTTLPITIDLATQARRHSRSVTGPIGHHLSPMTAGEHVTGFYLADQNFTGAHWQEPWKEHCGATVLTHDHVDTIDRHWFHAVRQQIESVFAVLTTELHIKYPRVRCERGLITHLVTVCAAFNLGIYLNRLYDRPDLAHGTLYCG